MFSLTNLADTVRIIEHTISIGTNINHTFIGVPLPCHTSDVMFIRFGDMKLSYSVELTKNGVYLGLSKAILTYLGCEVGDELRWVLLDKILNFEKA
jgi:hypothetical protein